MFKYYMVTMQQWSQPGDVTITIHTHNNPIIYIYIYGFSTYNEDCGFSY